VDHELAGLRAFELTPVRIATSFSTLGPIVAVLPPATRTAGAADAARRHTVVPAPAGTGGGPGRGAPSGPTPNAAGPGAAAGSGGLSSALWCDVLLARLVPVGLELRPNRVRPVLAGPVGVVSLLQRPG
jgi:hypothetical protein